MSTLDAVAVVNLRPVGSMDIEGDSVGLINANQNVGAAVDWRSTAKVVCQMAWQVFSKTVLAVVAISIGQALFTGSVAVVMIFLQNETEYTKSVMNVMIYVMAGTAAFGVAVGGTWGVKRAIKIYRDYQTTAYGPMVDVVPEDPQQVSLPGQERQTPPEIIVTDASVALTDKTTERVSQ
jgi:hypothetical protein